MRNPDRKPRSFLARAKEALFPVMAGTALFLTYPSLVSYQDIESLTRQEVSSSARDQANAPRWLASLNEGAGVSKIVTGSVSATGGDVRVILASAGRQGGLEGQLIREVRTKRKPQSVNRAAKGDRVVQATAIRPPSHFSAGSVLERHSMLESLKLSKNTELAFVKAKPASEALQIAAAFHPKKPKNNYLTPKPDLPVMVASLVTESVPNVLAYAPEPKKERSPFAEILADENGPVNIIPRLNKGDHAWAADPLPKASYSDREQRCLTAGIYFEARGEPVRGQAAVSQVILNRVRNPHYPDSICGVVYQNKHWRNRCQFSFACDRIKDTVNDPKRWSIAKYVARETTEGRIWLKEVGSSTHYHATYVNPRWARSMKRVGRIGLHIFYRTHNGGWS